MSDTDKPALTMAPQMYVHYCEEKECKECWGFATTNVGGSVDGKSAPRWRD
ncbi:hypothetical protein [Rhizobium leguminosarum]|uniref:hypothetical protein n=1 Tax=Rhizobium leguminosarum TaxID=384 RepID=UPI0013F14443|nr:hypothetical protein [Rhizobium leguminosarum]MBY5485407.1 hypothetical protein [Rhizobium leguminosarum]